jgi:hypothetical protein
MYDAERMRFSSSATDFFQKTKYRQVNPLKEVEPIAHLQSSKRNYEDFKNKKEQIDQMVKLREEKRFLAKRERLLANAWRHGVTGVDDPDHPESYVYKQK